MKSAENSMQASFDAVAKLYDAGFTDTWTGRMQRKIVIEFLEKNVHFPDDDPVLEINCGTGVDAIRMAERGFRVYASDISPEMIEVAKSKLQPVGSDNPKFTVCDMRLLENFIYTKNYRMIFSNFGGINCVSPDEIRHMNKSLDKILEPGGRLVFVVMGRNCLWEQAYFRIKGKKEISQRRKSKKAIGANIGDSVQNVWYYSPEELTRLLQSHFIPARVQPVGICIPPSYLDQALKKRSYLRTLLSGCETLFGKLSFLADYADHYLIEFKKR